MSETTVEAIYKKYEERNPPKFSKYISMGQLDTACFRDLWLRFHWAAKEQIDGRILRLMARGHREEVELIKDLKDVGCLIFSHDRSQRQIFLRGQGILEHLVGARDWVAFGGLKEHPNTIVVMDGKTTNSAKYKKMLKEGVAAVYPEYIGQIMLYMGFSNIQLGAFIVVNKETDHMFIEYIEFDKDRFEALLQRARDLVTLDRPPMRLFSRSSKAFNNPCKFCKNQKVCYGDETPEVNCRTCIHASPVAGGVWLCERDGVELSPKKQLEGCGNHLYIPEMLEAYEPLSGDDEAITYMHKTKKVIRINAVSGSPKGLESRDFGGIDKIESK